jgi:hypothetical protein
VAAAEAMRCVKSRSMLTALVDDSRRAEIQLAAARAASMRLRTEVAGLREQLRELTTTLGIKTSAFRTADAAQQELTSRLIANEFKKSGLCIRLVV